MDGAAGPPQKADKEMSQEKATPQPRFLVIKLKEGDFQKMSPFVLQRALFGYVGDTKSVQRTKEGLLVETVSSRQSEKLQKRTLFAEKEVSVYAHKSLNSARGVIFCRDLLNCSLEEIASELGDQGVVRVQRITTRRDGTVRETANHILTFNTPVLPKTVKVAFYRLDVRPYYPAPLRCFKCQRYGHTASSGRCGHPPVCVCGKAIHEGKPCDEPVTCVNCGGGHNVRSRKCPVLKKKMAVQELRVKEGISFQEARKRVEKETPIAGVSYAQVAAAPSVKERTISEIVREMIPHLVPMISEVVTAQISSHFGGMISKPAPPIQPVVVLETSKVPTRSQGPFVEHQDSLPGTSGSAKRKVRESSLSASSTDESPPAVVIQQKAKKDKRGWKKDRNAL